RSGRASTSWKPSLVLQDPGITSNGRGQHVSPFSHRTRCGEPVDDAHESAAVAPDVRAERDDGRVECDHDPPRPYQRDVLAQLLLGRDTHERRSVRYRPSGLVNHDTAIRAPKNSITPRARR